MRRSRQSALAGLLLALVVVGGSWIRLAGLGRNHFRGDELRHYFAAESIERGEGPLLPSGEPYVRGIDVTRLVGVFSSRIEDQVLAARLPGALFGVLNLILFAALAWMMGGPWAAVIATFLLAIHPESVAQSRRVRFYTYQLNFGLVALFAGWKAVEWTIRPPVRNHAVVRTWAWIALTAVAFALAARVQIVTLTVAAAWGLCLLGAGLIRLRRDGTSRLRSNVALQVCTLGLVLAVAAFLVRPAILDTILWHAFSVPEWVTSPQSPLSYYWALAGAFPLVVSLVPLIFLVTAWKRPWLAGYLLVWFGVPFLLHSLVLPFKGDRFILLAQPALMLVTGIAAAEGLAALFHAIQSRLGNRLDPALRRAAAGTCCAIVALAAVLTTPAFNAARRVPGGGGGGPADRENWTAAAQVLVEQPDLDSLVLGSSDEFAPLYYWPRLDFHAANGGEVDLLEISPATGVPRLLVPADIRRRYPDGAAVVVAMDSARLSSGSIDPGLHAHLLEHGRELCQGRCGSLLLYRWQFGPAAEGDTARH